METLNDLHAMSCMRLAVFVALRTRYSRDRTCSVRVRIAFIASRVLYMMLGQRDLRAKASMQCLFGLVNEPYFILFSSTGFNFKVLILGAWGLRPTHIRVPLPLPHAQVSQRSTVDLLLGQCVLHAGCRLGAPILCLHIRKVRADQSPVLSKVVCQT